jgi:AcrR family transcriptional regulator
MSEPPTDPETDRPNGSNGRHAGGRPRLPDTERAILKAVGELMAEQGVSGTTINAVAARSGVARGTVYRRWPNRSAMIAAAVRASRGWEPLELGDDVEVNFRQQAEEARRVLAEPSFQALMPALLEMGLTGQADDLVRSTVFPRRREMAEMYTICAAACGYRTDIAPELPNDLLVGAMIYHLLYDGAPPSSDEVQAMVGVILDGIRRRDDST